MFKIGEFSRFSRVSVKMLRHYDDIGLLKPAEVDPHTGYRYYSAEQLPRLNRIILLKDLDFSLDEILKLLDSDLSTDEIHGIFKVKRAEIEARIAADERRLSVLDRAQQQLHVDEALLTHAFIERDVPDQLVASIRKSVDDAGITTLFEKLETIVADHDARALRPPMTIFHDTEYTEDVQDVEVVIPVTKSFEPPEGVRVYTLKGATMVCIVYLGNYANTDPLIRQFPAWLEANGYQAAGALREVYLRFGADNVGYFLPEIYLSDSPQTYVTELQLPIEPITSSSRTHD